MASDDHEGSVTHWIRDVKAGKGDAAQRLWDRYFKRLVGLANRKLNQVPKQESDEEDVVIQALKSFFGGAKDGRFPRLTDRDDLWSLLASIVEHKALKVRSRHKALKRGGDKVRIDLDFDSQPARPVCPSIDDLSLELREQLNRLPDEQMRQIVMMILHGYSNAEIAEKLGVVTRTIERKRLIVRKRWEQEIG